MGVGGKDGLEKMIIGGMEVKNQESKVFSRSFTWLLKSSRIMMEKL